MMDGASYRKIGTYFKPSIHQHKDVAVKSCSHCIHMVDKKKKEQIETMDNLENPNLTMAKGNNEEFVVGSRYVNKECAAKHALKFGIIKCKDFERVKD